MKTAKEIHDELPNDMVELIIIGQSYSRKNPNLDESKVFNQMMESETANLIGLKSIVALLIFKNN